MSSTDFLENLLDGSEFQWKALGDIGTFTRGSGIQKSDFTESGAGCIHYGQIHTHYGTWATKTKSFINREFSVRLRKAHTGDIVIATTSEDDGAVAKAVAWLGVDDVAVSTDAYIYRHTINSKYMSYFFQTELFQSQKKPHITGTKVRRISGDSLAKIQIPIPCPENPKKSLEIQAEIVRILDAFAELTAELTARKKQYKHYRDQLLSFEEGNVEWKALSEIGEFIRGKRFTKADYVEDGISVIHYGEIYTRYGVFATYAHSQVRDDMAESLRYAEPGDVVITDVGETVEDVGKAVAWLGDGKVAIHDHCYAFRHAMNPKFVSYCMQTASFIAEKAKYVARTKVNTLLINGFSKIAIPVPYPDDREKSLAEQARIVAILDRFDALTHSISDGLPREIELRQKQYEHYRDLLLSFPKPKELAA